MDQATQAVIFSSKTDQHPTPQALFDELNAEFGPFTLDVAADEYNAKCLTYFDQFVNGLEQDWDGHGLDPAWMNPPYGRGIKAWVKKAAECKRRVVCLLPARTCTKWWHRYVWDKKADAPYPGVRVRFIEGRVKFGKAKAGAPFPSVVVVFR